MRPSARLLLVDDQRKLVRSLERQLTNVGYSIDVAYDGGQAIKLAESHSYELVILDLCLPVKSGLEVLQTLRADSYTTPVLILSANDRPRDRVEGLELGADDYLVKPFDTDELLARISAILRRTGHSRVSILEAYDLTLDVVKRAVRRAGSDIALSPRLFSLLEFLLRNKNQILTRRRIAESVWGYTFDTGTNVVDVAVCTLRKAVDEGYAPKLIMTIHGQGFMLKDS